jgi:IS4 transposase
VLNDDGVFWVTRSKESLSFRVVKKLPEAADKRILRDELVVLKNKDSRANYRKPMRRVLALVEIEGQEREMEFLTNNLRWSAGSVNDLYRCRWQIEVFFKQIKQSLQLCDFLGKSANAVRWQVWTALLLYVLMRFLCVMSGWNHFYKALHAATNRALEKN